MPSRPLRGHPRESEPSGGSGQERVTSERPGAATTTRSVEDGIPTEDRGNEC
jgi:hypothetical protein